MNGLLTGIAWPRFLHARHLERGAGPLNLALALLIAWTLVRLTWSLWPLPEQPRSPTAAPVAQAVAPGVATARLADLHLFGEASVETLEAETPLEVPETQLKLTLSGVLAANDKDSARAIIAGPDGVEQPYAVGDTLPGNATLKQILVDRVILQSGGRYETLHLPEESSPLDTSAPPLLNAPMLPGVFPGAGVDLQQYRQQLLNNPAQLAELVVPITQNGVFQGFRLKPGREARVLTRFGLFPGDLVTEVNGIALDDPTKGAQALQSLSTGAEVNLTVRRGNVEHRVSLRMSDLVNVQ